MSRASQNMLKRLRIPSFCLKLSKINFSLVLSIVLAVLTIASFIAEFSLLEASTIHFQAFTFATLTVIIEGFSQIWSLSLLLHFQNLILKLWNLLLEPIIFALKRVEAFHYLHLTFRLTLFFLRSLFMLSYFPVLVFSNS